MPNKGNCQTAFPSTIIVFAVTAFIKFATIVKKDETYSHIHSPFIGLRGLFELRKGNSE
jgi:hypothetical protein